MLDCSDWFCPTGLIPQSVVKAKTLQVAYSSNELKTIGQSGHFQVSLPVFHILKDLNLCTVKPTHRGSRGGKSQQRFIPVYTRVNENKHQRNRINSTNDRIHPERLIYVRKSQMPRRSAKNLQLTLVNPCSVRNKSADIVEYVVNTGIDVCLMTETWLKSRDAVSRAELKPMGYDFNDSPRPGERSGGGIGILFKNSIICKVLSSGELKSFEYAHYELSFLKSKLDIHVIYRPPYSTNHPVTTATFFNEFQNYLSVAAETPSYLLIAGDFNIHMDSEDDSDKIHLCNLLDMYGLIQHVDVATHKSGHCLDLIITRSNQELLLSKPVADYMISDHMFVCFQLNIPRPPLKESYCHLSKTEAHQP